MKPESAEGTWGVRGPPCSQLRRPKARWQQPRLDRCVRLDADRVSGLPPLPLYPQHLELLAKPPVHLPAPGAPCPRCTVAPSAAVAEINTEDQHVRTWSGLSQGSSLLLWDGGMTSDLLCHALRSPGQSCSLPEATSLAAPWLNESISVGTSAAHSWLTIWEALN